MSMGHKFRNNGNAPGRNFAAAHLECGFNKLSMAGTSVQVETRPQAPPSAMRLSKVCLEWTEEGLSRAANQVVRLHLLFFSKPWRDEFPPAGVHEQEKINGNRRTLYWTRNLRSHVLG